MKFVNVLIKAAKKSVMVRYHRAMSTMYRKIAEHHADIVIHTLHRVPTGSLAKLRGIAGQHTRKAKAIQVEG